MAATQMGIAHGLVLLLGLLLCLQSNCLSEEGQILLQVKESWNTNGVLGDWRSDSSGDDHCNWTGVICDNKTKSVVGLDLENLNISGTVPSSICKLSNLKDLDLSWNYLGGDFLSALLNCTRLQRLVLSENSFVGSLPDEIYKLEELVLLDLSSNNFSGDIPAGFGRLPKIEVLLLHYNLLNGSVPAFLGNISSLKNLSLTNNPLAQGVIPPELGNLTSLQQLWMSDCNLVEGIPESLGNITDMVHLDLSGNQLTGWIPSKLMALSNMTDLLLYANNLSGPIPENINNLKNLVNLDLSINELNGSIPNRIGELTNLETLHLYRNQISGSIPSGLVKLSNLVTFKLFTNQLTGQVPPGIGMGPKLVEFDISTNELSGPLPQNVCEGGVLVAFIVFKNKFIGSLPGFLGSCPSLTTVRVEDNQLSGEVPLGLWTSPLLGQLSLTNNAFHGQIPAQITKASSLWALEISQNQFSGRIPSGIGQLWNLSRLLASHNNISGTIPVELTKLSFLSILSLDHNMLDGVLPTTIISWKDLSQLYLANNRIRGSIPASLGSLPVLNSLDLSNNLLSGKIPLELEHLKLSFLNLSGNLLSGLVPVDYNNLAYDESFLDNPGLCGGGLLRLPSCSQQKEESQNHQYRVLIAVIAVVVIVCLIVIGFLYKTYKNFAQVKSSTVSWKLTPFHRVEFDESDILKRLTENNVIGSGGTGKVYKVTLGDGNIVAVKRICNNRKLQSVKDKEFQAEVDTLAKIRHANIVKLLCCISSSDSNLLVYEYMPNGSLYERLHNSEEETLDWPTRYNIAIGAAQGLSYLHHDCSPLIVHRDVKSYNILLDSELKAHVGDFGLARTLEKKLRQENVMSVVAGSYGYIAPEYAYTLNVNEKSDIYSFGVVLLELVTGKKLSDVEFGDDMGIVRWTRNQIHIDINRVLDSRIADSHREEMILPLFSPMAIVKSAPICQGRHDWRRSPKEIKADSFRSPSQIAKKMVCVTNGTSFLGLWIVRQLLLRGYVVRLTVHTKEELQKLGEMEDFALYSANNRLSGVVANVATDSIASISEAFDGCFGVFHTSSFIDPHGLSGYTEHMVNLEVKGAEKTVEACSVTPSVRRCVFTSSLAACIWQRHGFSADCEIVMDEKCWSDQYLCREKKLWLALSKTMSEKAAWRVAEERGGVNLVTVCPALLTGPAFSASCASSAVAYLKGAREMYEKNLLATVDVRMAAEAHVCVYEEMETGGSGRYICFDKLITRPEDVRDLEKKLNMGLGFSTSEDSGFRDEYQHHIGSHRLLNAKLRRIMDLSASARSCRHERQ